MMDIRKTRRRTILVVDDDDAVRALLRRALHAAGFSILEASDGAEALRVARGQIGGVGLLLTDVEMPGMRGPELAERLRAISPGIPVIYVTGNAGALSSSNVAGNDAVLRKPVEVGRLVRLVDSMASRFRPYRT